MEEILHILLHCFIDTMKVLPFLFLIYVFIEWLEHHSTEKSEKTIQKAGRAGPFIGALVGLVPQCGFSAAASGLYSSGIVSTGTLMAVFLSTSDEMIAMFLSGGIAPPKLGIILLTKFVIAALFGFLVDFFVKREKVFETHCHEEGCHCEERGILLSALFHTIKIFLFIFVISFLLHTALDLAGHERLETLFLKAPVLSNVIASLIGLIPNCASSVVIAEMYLEGIITAGTMMSGLFVGAGTGLLVLYRTCRNKKECIVFTVSLFVIGTIAGLVLDLVGWGALIS